jgi:hypothetical protein
MREPDEGSSGPPVRSDYKPVEVDVDGLVGYYRTMVMGLNLAVQTSTLTTLAPIGLLTQTALLGFGKDMDASVGPLPEGVDVARHMLDNAARFRAFFHDLGKGVQCIGDAAGVIAETYRGGDAANSATLGDLAFAFADPNATTPKGFPENAPTKTHTDEEAERANSTGQYAMALTMSTDGYGVKGIPLATGVIFYEFPDQSTKMVVTVPISADGRTGSTKTTTVSYHGKVVSTTVESTVTEGGKTTSTTTQAAGSNLKAPGAVTTQVETDSAGGQKITTKTYDDKGNDKVLGTVTTEPPPQTSSSGSGSDTGPIEQWEQQYDTQGTMEYVEKHGAGY